VETCSPAQGCVLSVAVAVDDGVACTVDACDPTTGAITHTPDHGVCDDHDACTGVETCDAALGCQPGTPVVCDDGLFCNGEEGCNVKTGACHAGTAPIVDDGIFCTLDSCDEDNDVVVHQPTDGLCGAGETCDPVQGCVPGSGPLDPTGTWSIPPGIHYSCTFGLVSLNYDTLSFAANGATLSVSPAMNNGCTMTGSSASGGDIQVSCTCAGTCNETYTLTGTFTDNDHWTGTWTAVYQGSCYDCVNQSVSLTATRQ